MVSWPHVKLLLETMSFLEIRIFLSLYPADVGSGVKLGLKNHVYGFLQTFNRFLWMVPLELYSAQPAKLCVMILILTEVRLQEGKETYLEALEDTQCEGRSLDQWAKLLTDGWKSEFGLQLLSS